MNNLSGFDKDLADLTRLSTRISNANLNVGLLPHYVISTLDLHENPMSVLTLGSGCVDGCCVYRDFGSLSQEFCESQDCETR